MEEVTCFPSKDLASLPQQGDQRVLGQARWLVSRMYFGSGALQGYQLTSSFGRGQPCAQSQNAITSARPY